MGMVLRVMVPRGSMSPTQLCVWLEIGAALDSFLGPDLGKGSVAAAGEGPPSQPTGTYGCRRTRVAKEIAGGVHVRVYSTTKAGTIETVL